MVPLAAAEEVDPADLLLFSVQLDSLTLSDGLAAYGDVEDPLLPVGELARRLGNGSVHRYLGYMLTALLLVLIAGVIR